MSRVRPIAPRLPLIPPPAPDRADPRRITTSDLAAMLAEATGGNQELSGWLVRSFRGISPQMAREIVFAATGTDQTRLSQLDDAAAMRLAVAVRQQLEPLLTDDWSPVVYRDEGVPMAFAARPQAHLAARFAEERMVSMSAAAEAVQTGAGDLPGRHDARKARLVASIATVHDKLAGRLASLQEELRRAEESQQFREWGDLIYAWLWSIKPDQTSLDVDGVTVPLDPAKSAKENAQHYFDEYKRRRDAGAHLPELVDQTTIALRYLDQLRVQTSQAQTFPEIESLVSEWDQYRTEHQLGGVRQPGRPRRGPAVRRLQPLYDRFGNTVYIGRSGSQNDEATFSLAGPNDTWLHARGVPGSHVIIRWRQPDGEEIDETVELAARLAGYYSALRENGQAEVDVTRRRYVRKIKGAGPGMVTYRNERTILVRPASESELSAQFSANRSPD